MIGAGGHARFVLAALKATNSTVKGLINLDDNYDPNERILKNRIVGSIKDLPKFFGLGYDALVLAIGSNKLRQEIYDEWVGFGFSFPTIVHPDACVDPSAHIGAANIVGPKAVIGAGVIIGVNNIINSSSVVEHETFIGNHSHISPGAVICGRVSLGDRVLVGANCTIIERLTIVNNTVLGAGATVIHSVSTEGCTLVGTPAKSIYK